jgi:hypothetical protein
VTVLARQRDYRPYHFVRFPPSRVRRAILYFMLVPSRTSRRVAVLTRSRPSIRASVVIDAIVLALVRVVHNLLKTHIHQIFVHRLLRVARISIRADVVVVIIIIIIIDSIQLPMLLLLLLLYHVHFLLL